MPDGITPLTLVLDDYVAKAFLSGSCSALGRILVFLAGATIGELFSQLADDYIPFDGLWQVPLAVPFAWGVGCLSGIGLVFFFIAFWWGYRVWVQDEPAWEFFWVIAGCQMGLVFSGSLVFFHEQSITGMILLTLSWFAVYWLGRKATRYLNHRWEAASQAEKRIPTIKP